MQVAPATAALAWIFSEWTIHGKPSVLVTAGYCAIATFILPMVVRLATGLRVEGDQESQGLDTALHGESVT